MMTADEYLEFKQEYCTGKGRPVPEHEVAEAYAEKRLSEQWKPYPENKPGKDYPYPYLVCYVEDGQNYFDVWYHSSDWDKTKHSALYVTHFMQIPKLPK